MKKFMTQRTRSTKGIATIPVILALGILIVVVALSVTALSSTEGFIAQGSYQSGKASLYAESGARDALMRIARNKNYSCATVDCYSLDLETSGCSLNRGCARVTVSTGAGTTNDPKIITSKGVVGNNTRIIEVRAMYDTLGSGEVASTTWQELTP